MDKDKQEAEDGIVLNQFHFYAEKEKKRLQRILTDAGYYPTKIQCVIGTGHLVIETRFATQEDLDRIKADI
jgi:hypothetical protein